MSRPLGPLLLKSSRVWGFECGLFINFSRTTFFVFMSTQMVDVYLSYLPMKQIWWKSAVQCGAVLHFFGWLQASLFKIFFSRLKFRNSITVQYLMVLGVRLKPDVCSTVAKAATTNQRVPVCYLLWLKRTSWFSTAAPEKNKRKTMFFSILSIDFHKKECIFGLIGYRLEKIVE